MEKKYKLLEQEKINKSMKKLGNECMLFSDVLSKLMEIGKALCGRRKPKHFEYIDTGDGRISGDAEVYDDGRISGNAEVYAAYLTSHEVKLVVINSKNKYTKQWKRNTDY